VTLALAPADIARLATRPGAHRAVVINFLVSLSANADAHTAYENARADARSGGWNEATLGAVIDGIALAASGQDDGTCRYCLDGTPVAFVGGLAACLRCVDAFNEAGSRPRDTLRCLPPVNDNAEVTPCT